MKNETLDLCEAENIPIVFSEQFYDFAPSISKWESKSRYIKNYTLALKQVERGMRYVKDFLLRNGVPEDKLRLPEVTVRNLDAF